MKSGPGDKLAKHIKGPLLAKIVHTQVRPQFSRVSLSIHYKDPKFYLSYKDKEGRKLVLVEWDPASRRHAIDLGKR